jgi:hypothetical protein
MAEPLLELPMSSLDLILLKTTFALKFFANIFLVLERRIANLVFGILFKLK